MRRHAPEPVVVARATWRFGQATNSEMLDGPTRSLNLTAKSCSHSSDPGGQREALPFLVPCMGCHGLKGGGQGSGLCLAASLTHASTTSEPEQLRPKWLQKTVGQGTFNDELPRSKEMRDGRDE